MIEAVFFLNNGDYKGVEISGHEEHDGEFGMICAAVSSCMMFVCNAVTEKFDASAKAEVSENRITLRLSDNCNAQAKLLLEAFREHLETLSEEYGEIDVEIVRIKV